MIEIKEEAKLKDLDQFLRDIWLECCGHLSKFTIEGIHYVICDVCGKRVATVICAECIYDGEGLLCGVCKQDHDCGEEMFLPVVNSPRCGACGYEGSTKYPNY